MVWEGSERSLLCMTMYDPSKYAQSPEFGAELRRRQSPQLARRTRRRRIAITATAIPVGIGLFVEAVGAVRAGRMAPGGRGYPPMTGYEAGLIALFLVALCSFALWRDLRNRE
jgi:hypothetical protein